MSKKILHLCQSEDASFVEVLHAAALSAGYEMTVASGSRQLDLVDERVPSTRLPEYDSSSFKAKIFSWMRFMRAAKKYLKNNIDGFDAVFLTSNPPINQSLVKFAKKKNKKVIYLVWDVYPDVIERVFGTKSKPLTAVWRRANRRAFSACDKVVTIGEVMRDTMKMSYPSLTIGIIPYHADTVNITPLEKKDNPFALKHGLSEKKVFMYSGKMGFGHGFSAICEAAKMLADRRDIVFVMIGHGPAFAQLEAFVRENRGVNMLLMGYQPVEMLPYTLTSADAAFITMKPGTEGTFLPSKVYDAMAAGSAILSVSGAENDIKRLTDKEGVGINVPADAGKIRDAVLRFADDGDYLKACRKSSRTLAEKYSMEKVTGMYKELFAEVLG